MKHIFAYTLSFVAIAATALMLTKASRAEDDPEKPELLKQYKSENGVATAKEVSSQNEDGSYTITLETFATGESDLEMKSKPADIILVLDCSSSMDQSNYTYKGQSMKRWRALRATTLEFVQTIYDQDAEARSKDSQFAGHRVAIVTYNRNALNITDGWNYINQVVSKSGNTYSGSLINTININDPGGVWANYNGSTGTDRNKASTSGTRPDHGLDMAINELLDGSPASKRANAALTVVLFTDGYPTDADCTGSAYGSGATGFERPIANKTLYYASRIKQDYEAKFYSIGLISDPTGGRQNNTAWQNYCRVVQMMDWLSSNYPASGFTYTIPTGADFYIETESPNGNYYNGYTSTGSVKNINNIVRPWSNAWTFTWGGNNPANDRVSLNDFSAGDPSDDKDAQGKLIDYSTIVDDNTSFDSVFKAIAEGAGHADAEIAATTQVRDVVSSSFVLPDGVATDLSKINLKIFTEEIDSDASKWINKNQLYPVSSGTPTVTPSIVKTADGHDALYVEGFYYSQQDNPLNSGNGNWVGVRYDSDANEFYAGKKLVIQFDIHANPDATGGQATATNTGDSGVYIKNDDNTYTNINSYEIPHTTIPVNIVITKTGLRHGESATFEIHRADILKDDKGNIVYNALGKPMPDGNWDENFSKVVVTNKGENGASVTKTLLSLDPGYVYRVHEDRWGWAYKMTGQGGSLTTADVLVNPFRFTNEEQTDKPKHAEAVTINHFESPAFGGSKEEHYKSSKIESF